MIAILHNRPFRYLFYAQTLSLLGTGLSSIALAQLAYTLSGAKAGQILGIALALKMLTFIFGAPLMSHLAHRLPRKAYLISLDLIRAGLLLCMTLVQQSWQVYVLIVLINLCSAGFTPVLQSIIPNLFDSPRDYTKALALTRSAYNLETLLSPLLAALLLLALPFHLLFILNSISFLTSAYLIYHNRFSQKPAIQTKALLGFKALYHYIKTPKLRFGLLLVFIATFAGAQVIVNTVVYVQGFYQQSESIMAMAVASFGLAALITSFLTPKLTRHYSLTSIMQSGGFICLISFAVGSISMSLHGIFIIWFALGIGSSLIETLVGLSIVESSKDRQQQGGFFTAYFALSHACWLCAYLTVGLLGHALSFNHLFLLLFSFSAFLLSIAFISNQKKRN